MCCDDNLRLFYWCNYHSLKSMVFHVNNVNIYAELCALVNKPSGASAGASDLKY